MPSPLHVADLRKSYGGNPILRGISLSIGAGEFVSLLGPSGSGKTTLLRCIAGLESPDPDSGEVRLGERLFSGKGTFLAPEHRGLGMVFQNYAVWPHLTVSENIAFPLRIQAKARGLAAERIEARVRECLAQVKLDSLGARYSFELSGGQQQRVAIARALAVSPEILLLDEPLSNLDALLREELGAEIRRLQQQLKLTTVLVTHDQREALSLSDRIVILRGGKIEAQGKPEELYRDPPSEFVAEFISGGQTVEVRGAAPSGQRRTFLPRRWKEGSGESFRLVSRVYLGSEYEYWAESPSYSEPMRFFSGARHEIGTEIRLDYRP